MKDQTGRDQSGRFTVGICYLGVEVHQWNRRGGQSRDRDNWRIAEDGWRQQGMTWDTREREREGDLFLYSAHLGQVFILEVNPGRYLLFTSDQREGVMETKES